MMPSVFPVRGPLAGSGRIVDTFNTAGHRIDPATGAPRLHHGVDVVARVGTPIVSSTDGTVVRVFRNTAREGNGVAIRDPDGWIHLYAHFRDPAEVAEGDTVHAGDPLGVLGMTGDAVGPHLHYQIEKNGKRINPTRALQASFVAYVRTNPEVSSSRAGDIGDDRRGWERLRFIRNARERNARERAARNAAIARAQSADVLEHPANVPAARAPTPEEHAATDRAMRDQSHPVHDDATAGMGGMLPLVIGAAILFAVSRR